MRTEAQRQYTVVVDTGNNDFGGNSYVNSFTVDDPDGTTDNTSSYDSSFIWKFYYGEGGDWYYPTLNGRAARWTPRLQHSGNYQVSVKFRADSQSGNVTYTLYNSGGYSLATVTVDQYSSTETWKEAIISYYVSLSNGCYVRASDISAGTNIDAVKFKFLN